MPVRRLIGLARWQKILIMVAGDMLALPICFHLAAWLSIPLSEAFSMETLLVGVALELIAIVLFVRVGVYRVVVRYVDLWTLAKGGFMLALMITVVYLTQKIIGTRLILATTLVAYWFMSFSYLVGSRAATMTLLRWGMLGISNGVASRARTGIYGAGDAGAQLAQGMLLSREYQPICFFDDAPSLHGKTISGLPIFSPDKVQLVAKLRDLDQIAVAIPSLNVSNRREIIKKMECTGLPIRILPGLVDLIHGRVTLQDLREVEVADLLGREPVRPRSELFSRCIRGKGVLVTGAGGSIGSELCRQITTQKPARLILLDHSEYSLYLIHQELTRKNPNLVVVPVLGSVCNETLVSHSVKTYGVDTIYHAAAYKHVPMVEASVEQGVFNNVVGAKVVAKVASEANIETCVLISTDKAVRPAGFMGASKRIAELVFQAAAQRRPGQTVFSMVRFGNVLGSSGSVVPLFQNQLEQGGPITVTHRDITRFFMLIPEAAQLVIQAGAMASGGEVFLLDMGEPIKIIELARQMIRLSGLTEISEGNPSGDIEIKITGLRPGEKMYEELQIGQEVERSEHPCIMRVQERMVSPEELDTEIEVLEAACNAMHTACVVRSIRILVPEYRPLSLAPPVAA